MNTTPWRELLAPLVETSAAELVAAVCTLGVPLFVVLDRWRLAGVLAAEPAGRVQLLRRKPTVRKPVGTP